MICRSHQKVKMKFIINIIITISFQFYSYVFINSSTCLGFLSTNNRNIINNKEKKKVHDDHSNFQFRTYQGVVTWSTQHDNSRNILLLRAKNNRYYNYFAFGSNMALSTMTALRGINPISYQPAILPNHKLSFNVPGTPFIEPSWASVEPVIQNEAIDNVVVDNDVDRKSRSKQFVHGILYKLSETDFEKICSSEGVPFAYTLHRCRVIPYVGDGLEAGKQAYNCQIQKVTEEKFTMDQIGVPTFTLRAARKKWRNQTVDIPPSVAYMNVIIKGAEQFKIDSDYVKALKMIPTGKTIGNGMADKLLDSAVFLQSIRRNFIS